MFIQLSGRACAAKTWPPQNSAHRRSSIQTLHCWKHACNVHPHADVKHSRHAWNSWTYHLGRGARQVLTARARGSLAKHHARTSASLGPGARQADVLQV